MLLDGGGDPGDIREPLRLVEEESARLLELLSALLDMTRGEQGRISLEREPTDLAALTRSALAFHSRAASAKSQTITAEFGAGCPTVTADPHRIRQVIDNLISNAIKFGPPGTRIRVDLGPVGGEVVWSVADQGPGLAAEDFPKLFQSFQKLSAHPTAGEPSTGLGLALSRNIVELHLGRIWAENCTDAAGARFSFALPTSPEVSASLRVLVLDGDPACRELAGSVLAGLGHSPTACESLDDAVRSMSGGRPDAVLADIRMSPHEIRAAFDAGDPDAPGIPLVALSASDEGFADGAAGWDARLLKPLDPELLRAMLHRLARTNPPSAP
jgi:CheY-like chemotaxis protein